MRQFIERYSNDFSERKKKTWGVFQKIFLSNSIDINMDLKVEFMNYRREYLEDFLRISLSYESGVF